MLFPALDEAPQEAVALHHLLAAFANLVQRAARHQAREHLGQRADVLADRHLVVVQDHEQVGLDVAAVVERLERHARGHRAVADHGDDLALVALALRRDRHGLEARHVAFDQLLGR